MLTLNNSCPSIYHISLGILPGRGKCTCVYGVSGPARVFVNFNEILDIFKDKNCLGSGFLWIPV